MLCCFVYQKMYTYRTLSLEQCLIRTVSHVINYTVCYNKILLYNSTRSILHFRARSKVIYSNNSFLLRHCHLNSRSRSRSPSYDKGKKEDKDEKDDDKDEKDDVHENGKEKEKESEEEEEGKVNNHDAASDIDKVTHTYVHTYIHTYIHTHTHELKHSHAYIQTLT